MNVALAPTSVELSDGEVFRDGGAWVVKTGEVEIYATLGRDSAPASTRRFIGPVGEGSPFALAVERGVEMTMSAVAVGPATLERAAADIWPTLGAAALDSWVATLGRALVGNGALAPPKAVALASDATTHVPPGCPVTARGGVVWLERAGKPPTPLVPGLFAPAPDDGEARTASTDALLARRGGANALLAFQAVATRAVAEDLVRAEEAAGARAQARAARDADLGRRIAGRFVGVFGHAPTWTGAASPEEPFLAPVTLVAEALAIDLPARVRQRMARASSVEAAARAARVRQRRIALRGEWWREDFGPFIGFLDAERRPVAVLQKGAGRYRIVDPDGGVDILVDARSAGRLAPFGHMLYAPLPARPLSFADVSRFGQGPNARDFKVAILAGAAMALLGVAAPLSMRVAFDRFIPANEAGALTLLGTGLVIVALIGAVSRYAFDAATLRMDSRANSHIHAAMVDRILRLPAHALRIPSADLALRAAAVAMVRRSISGIGIGAALSGAIATVNLALMLLYAPTAAVLALAATLSLLGLAWLCATRQLDALRKGEEMMADVNTIVVQLLNGVGALRAAGAEDRAFARWGQDFAELKARGYRSQRWSTLFETMLAGFDMLTLAGVLLFLAAMDRKELPVGAFIAFVWSYAAFMTASGQLARSLNAAIGLTPSWERGRPLLAAVPEDGAPKRDPGVLTGAAEVTNVHFRYADDAPFALGGVSLRIEPGEFVALVGASGSGKSTLMRVLLGQDQPQGGSVAYDGTDLRHLDLELVRRQIGVVLQNGRLSPGSIFENVCGPHQATLEQVWEALRSAGLEDDVRALPMGLHTVLTEATAAFSGGQVQRLLIARALIGRPRLLLFDEATSALDNLTQQVVTESLARMAVTRVVIAHRLVTVRQANRIVVLDKGRVVESGTYDELAAGGGAFAAMLGRQLL